MMFMNVFWVLILIGSLLLFIKYLSGRSKTQQGHGWFGTNALEIVKERYARGEIDQTEYEQKKRDLEEVR
jgi:putative membrane protein